MSLVISGENWCRAMARLCGIFDFCLGGRADWLAWATGRAQGLSITVVDEARYVPRGSNSAGDSDGLPEEWLWVFAGGSGLVACDWDLVVGGGVA